MMSNTQIEGHNLGRPTCQEISINPKKWGSNTVPQACEYNGNWYYNYPGALAEAKHLGKRLPDIEEWKKIIKTGWKPEKYTGRVGGKGDETKLDRNGIYANYWAIVPEDYLLSSGSSYTTGFAWFNATSGSSSVSPYIKRLEKYFGYSVRCIKK